MLFLDRGAALVRPPTNAVCQLSIQAKVKIDVSIRIFLRSVYQIVFHVTGVRAREGNLLPLPKLRLPIRVLCDRIVTERQLIFDLKVVYVLLLCFVDVVEQRVHHRYVARREAEQRDCHGAVFC